MEIIEEGEESKLEEREEQDQVKDSLRRFRYSVVSFSLLLLSESKWRGEGAVSDDPMIYC